MSGKTKIVVFRMKELIYTLVFIVLAIVLILLLVFMFRPGKDKEAEETAAYTAGVYTSSIQFQGQTIDVQVVVDENHINAVSFVNLDESVATMYPLMQSSMDSISQQIYEKQSLDDITYSEENQYTATMLLNAVNNALDKARGENASDPSESGEDKSADGNASKEQSESVQDENEKTGSEQTQKSDDSKK